MKKIKIILSILLSCIISYITYSFYINNEFKTISYLILAPMIFFESTFGPSSLINSNGIYNSSANVLDNQYLILIYIISQTIWISSWVYLISFIFKQLIKKTKKFN